MKAAVRSSRNCNLCTLIIFFFLLAFVSSTGTVSSRRYLTYPFLAFLGVQSSFFSAEHCLCYSCLYLLTQRIVELVILSYALNSGGCSLWIVFDSDIPIALDSPKTSCVGNTWCNASSALAISDPWFTDWNVSVRDTVKYLILRFNQTFIQTLNLDF